MALSLNPLRTINELADQVFPGVMPGGMLIPEMDRESMRRAIPCDVVEKDKEYWLLCDLPGLTKTEVRTFVDNDVVRVCVQGKIAERHDDVTPADEDTTTYHRMERTHRYVERALRFPNNADLTKLTAKLDHGVLHITIPKTPDAGTQPRGVPVQIA